MKYQETFEQKKIRARNLGLTHAKLGATVDIVPFLDALFLPALEQEELTKVYQMSYDRNTRHLNHEAF